MNSLNAFKFILIACDLHSSTVQYWVSQLERNNVKIKRIPVNKLSWTMLKTLLFSPKRDQPEKDTKKYMLDTHHKGALCLSGLDKRISGTLR